MVCVLGRLMNKIITAICDSGDRTFQKEIKEEDRQQWNALGSFVKEQVESHNSDVQWDPSVESAVLNVYR